MTKVRFKTSYGKYNSGEIAGFDDHIAKALCSGDQPVAELVKKKTKTTTAPTVDKRLKGPGEENTSFKPAAPNKNDVDPSEVVTKSETTSQEDETKSSKKVKK